MSDMFGVPNEPEASSLLDVTLCLEPVAVEKLAPYDRFDETIRSLVIRAWGTRVDVGNGETKDNDPELVRLLLLGLVSGTENYFRQVLSRLLTTCPESQRICASTEIKFSAARYHQQTHIASSLLDESVFSSSENIETETKRLTGISPSASGSVKQALAEYHKVCIIRHATVHSHGYIGAKNITDLRVKSQQKLAVSVSVKSFESIAEICVNLVRAYNSHMWRAVVGRLENSDFLVFDGSDSDRVLFKDLQAIFWSAAKLEVGQEGFDIYEKICASRKKPVLK